MNMKLVKRMLTVCLTVALVAMPLTVGATTDTSSKDSTTATPATTVVAQPSFAEYLGTPQVTVGGKVVKSTVGGAFVTKNVAIAVTTPAADIKAAAGLKAGEVLFFKGWEFTAKNSPLAYQALDGSAKSVGGKVLQCVELNYGKKNALGKFEALDPSIKSTTTISLPKNADKTKKHALTRAAAGGATEILENKSTDPSAITSDIPGGPAAYGIIEY